MKILNVHAHFDDFELTAGGTFEMWRRDLGTQLSARVLVFTDGAAGHYCRSREETASIRLVEQKESAKIGGYEFQLLKLPDGSTFQEGGVLTRLALGALWKAIRAFEPDYLFCPPLPSDPLMGVHTDHLTVAEAVRRVAYLINVPHAFSDIFPTDETHSEPLKTPVILNVYDGYMFGANQYDLAVDVEEAFPVIAQCAYCHRSQFQEWIPWIGRHEIRGPTTFEEWSAALRGRMARQRQDMGVAGERALEFFTVTAWGATPKLETLKRDLPWLCLDPSRLAALGEKLLRWGVL